MKNTISKKFGLILLVVIIMALTRCAGGKGELEVKKVEVENPYSFEDIIVKGDMEIPDCELRQLNGRLLFITSAHCPHCKKDLPKVEKIIKDRNIGDIYENIDTSSAEGQEMLEGAGIRVQYVPTLIFNCKAYVGGKYSDKYGEILSKGKY